MAREASRTKFEGLDPGQAAKLAGEAFPHLVDDPAGGAPQLPAGQRIVTYTTPHTAQLELSDHKSAVLESLSPIAIETSPSKRVPIDLSLSEAAGQFRPARGLVGLGIPRRLPEGISLTDQEVSLTPVDERGHPLTGSGSLLGASVLYANTQTDTDTLAKPTTDGFEVDSLLRSVESPEQLRYLVGMPAGATLVSDTQGGARVELEGQTIVSVLPLAAQDAAESSVPVSMSVSGDLLVVSVNHRSGSYQYPIDVDPSIIDTQLQKVGAKRSNWEFETVPAESTKFGHTNAVCKGPGEQYLETCAAGEYKTGEFAQWHYQTRGNSKIYEFKGETEAENTGAKIESRIELEDGGTTEEYQLLSTELKEPKYAKQSLTEPLCPKGKTTCTSGYGGEKNAVHFQQSTAGSGSKFFDYLYAGELSITEPEEHATTKYNTTSPELEGEVINVKGEKEKIRRKNVMDGGGWLSEHDGAVELVSEDKGIGVSATQLEFESSPGKWEQVAKHNYLTEEDLCKGYQCEPKDEEFWVLSPKLPSGEDKIRYRAEDGMGSSTESTESEGVATVKVDTSKPRKLRIGGLPFGNELSEKPYNITVEATDGEGSTVPSSGIESLALYIDGGLIGTNGGTGGKEGTEGKCSEPKGECSASAKWTFNGAELGAGKHQIEVIARDKAGNEERLYDPISIRHSTPVSLGPGSVDLESGGYALSTTDVSMGSGLTVSRGYSSRALEEGVEGTLGPQWNLTVGGSAESLVELVDQSMMLTGNNGRQTIFAKTGTTTYESPTGDSNLTLKLEENKETKAKEAFYLEDAADHTKVKFTLPGSGTKVWVPTRQEGAVATDTVTYKYQSAQAKSEFSSGSGSYPEGIVTGPDGNLWAADYISNQIEKITTSGAVTTYALPSGSDPEGITVGPDGNPWFCEKGTNKIGKITTSGTITEYSLGSGMGPTDITTGADGALWVTAYTSSMIVRITTSGEISEYPITLHSGPQDIAAGPEGDLWWTDYKTGNIGKISLLGEVMEYAQSGSNQPYGMTAGPEGYMWFTDSESNNIGKITPSGTITLYKLPGGSEPFQIATGPDGNLWFTDFNSNEIGRITPTGTITEYSQPTNSQPVGITVGPDGNLWYTDFDTSKIGMISPVIAEPSEALAPVPSKVECGGKLETMHPGCRALKFEYATKTTAKTEGESEWGEYNGRLSRVFFVTYNLSSKTMQEVPVAEYAYDDRGRLRAVWDPRIEKSTSCGGGCSVLKTTYGYDAEGHVTAMTAPGKESWAFTYGAIAGDTGTGRLLRVTQASASASLWGGSLSANTEAPKITGSPVVGVRLAASNGAWSNSPVTYAYQWEDCNSSGAICTPIAGATNPNYTPTSNDVGYTLRAQVSATNGGGTVAALTIASSLVQTPEISEKALASGSGPIGVVTGPDKNLWVADLSTSKISKITTTGTVTEYSLPSGSEPVGIAVGSDNNLWFTEYGTSKIGKITTSGTITEYSLPSGSVPYSIAPGPDSNLWFTEYGTSKIGKITTSGTITEYSLPSGSDPDGITVGPDKALWFTDRGTGKIGKITTGGTVIEWSLAAKSEPAKIVAGPDGNLWFTAYNENFVGKITTEGIITNYSLPSGSGPLGIAAGPDKNLWFTEHNSNKIGRITTEGAITESALPSGSNPNGIAEGPDKNLWFVDTGTNELGKVNFGAAEGEVRTPQPGSTIDYNVPLEGSSAPAQMGVNPTTKKPETEQWGQTEDVPVEATSIFPPDSPQGWRASSYTRATTYYLDEEGRLVNIESASNGKYGSISTTEYNEENDVTRTLTPDNRATALEADEKSVEVATLLSTFNTYKNKCSRESEFNEERESSESGTRLCETEGPEHMVRYTGTEGQEEGEARDHVRYFYDEKVPAEGPNKESFSKESFNLVTETQNFTEILGAKGRVEEEIEPRTTVTSYSGQNNTGWVLRAPTSVTIDTETGGQKLKNTTLYNEAGQVTETRTPDGESGSSPHDAKIVYYTPENEAEVTNCRKHPEWTGLVCETLPAKQPETSGVPNLPVTETTYNMWDEAEKETETITFPLRPTVTRTKVDTYDVAGRLTTSETTATNSEGKTEGKTLPKVTYEYESKQGMQDDESIPVGSKTKTIMSKFNTLGQLTEYSDASEGNIAKYTYGGPEKDFQIEEVGDSSNGAKSRQTYTYNKNTMQLETLWDSAAETFTASYDTEGKLTSEIYPNGMCANYTYNSVGEATHLEYIKTTNCAEGSKAPVWYSESIGSTVRGEMLSRTNTLATENYKYDTLGRLTETQETPAGGECSVRLYEYEKESNRTKLTSRKPGSKGECATTGGTEEKHTYDEANRMTDTGIEYEGLGNVTKLPAVDAEGHELKSTFYVDGAVASQSQNGVTNEYALDPGGRILTTTSGVKTAINHYDGPGEAVAWTCEAATGTETCESGKWTRNIPGIDGALAAVQTNGGTPILQLHDLKGDVVATAELSSSATKLLSTYNSTEFGVPEDEKTLPPFAWLGAADISKSLSSGVITYGATSYVPQTASTLQTLPVQSPGYPVPIGGGTYATFTAEPWNMQGGARVEAEAPGTAAVEQREAWETALAAAEDPIYHYRAWEAKQKAEEIGKAVTIANIAELITVLFGNLGDAADGIIQGKWSNNVVEGWAIEYEEFLEFCVETLHGDKDSHGGCRASYKDLIWEGSGVPNFFLKVEISYCLKMTSNAVEVHECTLEAYRKSYEVEGVV